ncbi:MAG TPA: PEGA domain-containing protein, partial [Spirochaetota bacterium]|nr:PEGA domain-containing protein [Spirochaetota bacterium]
FFASLPFFLFSVDIIPDLLKNTDSQLLKDMFKCNVGIMRLKSVGKISKINPLDSQNAVNSIKNNLDEVTSIRLTKKAGALKALIYLKSKLNEGEKKEIELLERKIRNSGENIDNSYIYELFLFMKKNPQFLQIAKQWFENYFNPFYLINIEKPFLRTTKDDKFICETETLKVSDNENAKGKLDFLFSGTIEKIDDIYFINIYAYSYFDDKIIADFSIVSDGQNIPLKINEEMEKVIPKIFLVNYCSLSIKTDDYETGLYIDSNYVGKGNETANYLVPGRYVVTLKKNNYIDRKENVFLSDYEKKEISIKIEKEKPLQTVNFYIEPLGTKIFINSIYQGKTPFKKALPQGNYIISAKNSLYEDYRYYLNINEIEDDEINAVFHLKSKNLVALFEMKKILYYTAFWNFTFGLTTTVPILIFAYDYFYKYGAAYSSYQQISEIHYNETEEGKNMYVTQAIFYGLAWGFGFYAILGIGWLFFS